MSLLNKRVLVTGGAGFIGSHFVDRLLTENPKEIIVVDNLFLGNIKNIKNKGVKLFIEDVSLQDKIKKIFNNKIDVVFNLAVVPLLVSLTEPIFCFNKNIQITMNLCELLRLGAYNELVHFSSSEVYGSAKFIPMDETHPLYGLTPYAASKAACDQLIFSYIKTFDLDIMTVRPFNVYGPRQNQNSYAGIIPKNIKRILNGESPIIEGSGNQTRDFTFVTDIVDTVIKLYNLTHKKGLVVNIASGSEITVNEIINKINKNNLPIFYSDRREGDVDRHLADIGLLTSLINYKPQISFNEGIEKTIEWYKKEGVS